MAEQENIANHADLTNNGNLANLANLYILMKPVDYIHCIKYYQKKSNRDCLLLFNTSRSVVFNLFHIVAHFSTQGNLITHFGQQNLIPVAKIW